MPNSRLISPICLVALALMAIRRSACLQAAELSFCIQWNQTVRLTAVAPRAGAWIETTTTACKPEPDRSPARGVD